MVYAYSIEKRRTTMKYDYCFGSDCYTYCFSDGVKHSKYRIMAPEQSQSNQPGLEYLMTPRPVFDNPNYIGSGKLKNKVAIITGGDSGLGRAAAICFAKEGATLVIPYLNEHRDALETKKYIEQLGGTCLLLSGDITDPAFCSYIVQETIRNFGKIDVLVNNAGVQYQQDTLTDISNEQFDRTMKVNVYGMFYLTKAALPFMSENSSIINMTSVTTFFGDPQLIDYVATKGAIVGFTRALARNLAEKKIRVNAIAPGFFWTPLQPACWQKEKIPSLGADAAMRRGAMPYELAPTFVFLASDDSSYVTGQVIHNNGGQIMG